MQGKGISGKQIIYYTMGEEKWKTTTVWPPIGQKHQILYLNDNFSLKREIPSAANEEDKYAINFNATTGKKNRWFTEMGGGPVIYKKRAREDNKLLTYTSSPLTEDLEITGFPLISLYIKSTRADGAIFVYLEDVDKCGKVIYITEGQMRLIHRKISTETHYDNPNIHHSYLRKDGLPMPPNKVEEIKFSLLPTSVLIQKGHRIRIAIAGADKGTFARIPKRGNPIITLLRTKGYPSSITLPIIPE